jgi:hypothetical protein
MTQEITTMTLPRLFRQTALEKLGAELVRNANKRFAELLAEHPLPDNHYLKWHLREYILPGLAVYQAMRAEGRSQESALTAFDQIVEVVVAPNQRQMSLLGQFPLIYPLLRLVIRSAMRQYPEEGWQTDWVENSREAIRFNMRSCFYFDVLSRHGAPELTASFCRGDDLVYGQMSPHLEWKRTQTIGRGAEYCDFCFARTVKGKKEGRQS